VRVTFGDLFPCLQPLMCALCVSCKRLRSFAREIAQKLAGHLNFMNRARKRRHLMKEISRTHTYEHTEQSNRIKFINLQTFRTLNRTHPSTKIKPKSQADPQDQVEAEELQSGQQLDDTVNRSVGELADEWTPRTYRAGMIRINPMHTFRTACKQSESERSMAAKMLIAPGHPLPQVLTCKLSAAAIFYKSRSVECMETGELADTYRDDRDDDISNPKVGQTARMAVDGRGADVDGRNDLGSDLLGALVVPAGSELGEDRVALVAERVEGSDDVVVRPLRDDFWDGPGEGNDTSGENSEDGGETHGEDVRDEAKRPEKATLAESDWVDEKFDQSAAQVL